MACSCSAEIVSELHQCVSTPLSRATDMPSFEASRFPYRVPPSAILCFPSRLPRTTIERARRFQFNVKFRRDFASARGPSPRSIERPLAQPHPLFKVPPRLFPPQAGVRFDDGAGRTIPTAKFNLF